MAVSAAFDFDVPAPYDTFFVSGEKAISVADPIDTATGRTNYHLAVWTNLEGGEYLLRIYAKEGSSWASSVPGGNIRVIHYAPRNQAPSESLIVLPRGRQRIDIVLSRISTDPGECWFAFSLWQNGKLAYTSNAGGWVFNTGVIDDSEIPEPTDYRLTMPVLTVLPNWREPIGERITYATEVLSSENDTEQRRSLRLRPRRSFEMTFSRSRELRPRLDSFFTAHGKHDFQLPMWHEQYVLTGALGGTLTFPLGTLSSREFRAGMYVLVMNKDPVIFDVLKISAHNLETDTITLTGIALYAWGAGDRIVPLRLARALDSVEITNPTTSVGESRVRFQIADSEPRWFDPSWVACSPRFWFSVNRASDVTHALSRPTAYVTDAGVGPIDVYDNDQRERIAISASLSLTSREEVFGFRQFIDQARGRAVRFWMPSQVQDLIPTAFGSSTIDIRAIGLVDYFRVSQSHRGKLEITYLSSSRTTYFDIEDVEVLSDPHFERVTVSSPLGAIDIDDVRRVSYIYPVRFDHDAFELTHLVAQSEAVTTSVVLRSVENTGMPSPECIRAYVSHPYPIEVIESLDALTNLWQGAIYEPIASINVTAMIEDGGMYEAIVYKSKSVNDLLDVNASFLSGELVVVIAYKTITTDVDSFNVESSLLSGTLVVGINYVTHTIAPEAINVTSTFVSGSLV